MPRKSAASLAVVPDPVELDRRLPLPEELTPEEAQIWQSIVATKPSDWFQQDSAALLVAYCRHITTSRFLDEQITAIEGRGPLRTPDELDFYKTLIDKREKQSRVLASLATKMRLSQQARYDT